MKPLIRWPKLLNPTQLSQIIRDNQKNPLTAFRIFNEAKSKYPNYRHNGPVYATMINILAGTGRLSEMKDVIYQMKQDSCECKDSIFATVIQTYANSGLIDEAVSLFRNLPHFNCVNWTQSFNTLLHILLQDQKHESTLLETARELYLNNSIGWEVRNRIPSLNLFIEALCRRNRSDLALEIFQEMNSLCCYPDRNTYTVLMRGLCEDGRLNEATHLLYSMFWRISQKGSGEDIIVYRTLLEAMCDSGQVEEAVEILGKVLRKGLKTPKQRRQGVSVRQFREIENLEGIKGLINLALIKGVVPSLSSYSATSLDLYSQGKIDDADRVFDESRQRGFCPSLSMYEAKIEALCREGRAGIAAVKVIEEEMVEGNCVPTVQTYKILVKGLCGEGKSMVGLRYLGKMDKQVGCVADKELYNILVEGLCSERRFIEASKVFEKMLNKRYWPSVASYNRLVEGLCVVGRRYEVVLWLEEMTSQGEFPDVSLWNSLVKLMCSESTDTNDGVKMLQHLTNSS
ncbi:hypothetical protein AQUCO_01700472v1 [Aquilegia coerulea]|uniref:Pentacotripeptide-repeat region of PRORP domain-containing protein n=1 Tax=Aquilegia coerulea TaxID=218851 RepID=A0A2G5DN41_AQUCA|nr:hypothetical protein AQUCO_01700472v1 [Aquilegia coerulea]